MGWCFPNLEGDFVLLGFRILSLMALLTVSNELADIMGHARPEIFC